MSSFTAPATWYGDSSDTATTSLTAVTSVVITLSVDLPSGRVDVERKGNAFDAQARGVREWARAWLTAWRANPARDYADAGATHVIVGHSERRTLFGETDAMVLATHREVKRP